MSVVLPPLITNDGGAATNFLQSPTIQNPQLTSTNTNFLATTAQVKTAIPTPNSASELVTNVAQTITGSLTLTGTSNRINLIDNAGTVQIGSSTNNISLGASTSNVSILNVTIWTPAFPNPFLTNNVTTGGTAGFKVGRGFRQGSADLTGVTSLAIAISATVFTSAPTVILTPYSTGTTPLAYSTYWVTAVTTTSFTINSSTTGRRFHYILLGPC